jgi:hypothetical protein
MSFAETAAPELPAGGVAALAIDANANNAAADATLVLFVKKDMSIFSRNKVVPKWHDGVRHQLLLRYKHNKFDSIDLFVTSAALPANCRLSSPRL